MKSTIIAIICTLLTLSSLLARPFDESLKATLSDAPATYQVLLSSLEFKKVDFGNAPSEKVDLDDPSKGMRATWTFQARPKGQEDGYPLEINISVITIFIDDSGHATFEPGAQQAKRFVEKVAIYESKNSA